MPSEGFPFIVGGSEGWTLVRLEWLVASSSHRRRVGVGSLIPCLWGKLQNLSFSKVSKQVVMLFFVAGVALCDIPTCLLTCRKCQNWRMSRTKCSFCCAHVFVVQSSIVNFYQIEYFSSKNSFPHNFVWPPASSSPHTPPTISPPIFVTPTISPPIFVTPSVSTIIFHIHISTIFVNHHLGQPSVPTTNHHLFVNHLCQPPSFTYIFQPSLSTTIFHMHICQPSLSTTIFHIHISTILVNQHLSHTCQPPSFTYISVKPSVSTIFVNHLCQPPSFTYIFVKPSVSTIFVNHHLSHTYFSNHLWRRFAWQAWHSETFTFVLRGRRGTYGTGWRAWTGLVADDIAALCVAGVAQGDIHQYFCVAGVALGDIHLRFAWQTRHLWHWVARLDRVAGVALGDIHLRFAWQAWHLWRWVRGTLRGRRGTRRHSPSFCKAGVALMALGGALGPD